MAQQLQKRGTEVALLALLDCQVPSPDLSKDVSHARLMIDFIAHLIGSFLSPLPEFQQFDTQYLTELHQALQQLPEEQQIALILEQVRRMNITPADLEPSQFKHLISVFRANYRAVRGYQAKSYSGRVVFFSSEEVMKHKGLGPAMGWDQLITGNMEVHTLPGSHYALIRGSIARRLAELLSASADRLP
jgi:thioesterase domain-containing protein